MTQNKKNFLIAITGGIGSGKSTVLSAVKNAGGQVISCDEITRALYNKHDLKARLQKLFPSAISGKTRLKADKKELARLCFNDDGNYAALCDAVTYPTFQTAMKKAAKFSGAVFMEVPLLFEYGLEKEFDAVIVIVRNYAARIESVKKRSALTENEIEKRMARQFDYSGLTAGTHGNITVIENDGDETSLKEKVLSVCYGLGALRKKSAE